MSEKRLVENSLDMPAMGVVGDLGEQETDLQAQAGAGEEGRWLQRCVMGREGVVLMFG